MNNNMMEMRAKRNGKLIIAVVKIESELVDESIAASSDGDLDDDHRISISDSVMGSNVGSIDGLAVGSMLGFIVLFCK